jgi:phospholipid/cholesterol/gamma-HCH transport system ATP-binding protein
MRKMADRDDATSGPPAVVFEHVSLSFDDRAVLRDISFTVPCGRMTVLLGASGAGKSVILKLILGLLKPDAGAIYVYGQRIDAMDEAALVRVRDRIGMLFQESALFDSLTVADNVGYKLREVIGMPEADIRRRVAEVLGFIGLEEFIDRKPSELSGGQRRRVAIARAMAARPQLLLFDDPTSGLDPILAKTVDAEIIKLRDLEDVTSIVVTHQLPDVFYIANHQAIREGGRVVVVPVAPDSIHATEFLVLRDGRIFFRGDARALCAAGDTYLRTFLTGWIPPLVA